MKERDRIRDVCKQTDNQSSSESELWFLGVCESQYALLFTMFLTRSIEEGEPNSFDQALNSGRATNSKNPVENKESILNTCNAYKCYAWTYYFNTKVCRIPSCKTSKRKPTLDYHLMHSTGLPHSWGSINKYSISAITSMETGSGWRTWLGFRYGCGESITEKGDREIHGSFTVTCRKGESGISYPSCLPYKAII